MAQTTGMNDGNKSPEEHEREIAETRAEMSETLDAIQRKLDPNRLQAQATAKAEEAIEKAKEHVVDTTRHATEEAIHTAHDATIGRAQDWAHDVTDSITHAFSGTINPRKAKRTARRAGYSMLDRIRDNPLPAALAALGIGWLLMEDSNRDREVGNTRYYEQPRRREYYDDGEHGFWRGVRDEERGMRREGMLDRAKDAVEDAADTVTDKVGDLAHEAQERVGDMSEAAQRRVQRMTHRDEDGYDSRYGSGYASQYGYESRGYSRRSNLESWIEDNPIAVGAAALAIGAMIGSALPHTSYEDRWMGPKSDELIDRVESEAQQKLNQAKSTLHEAEEVAKAGAQAAKQELTQGLREEAEKVAHIAKDAATAALNEAKQTVKEETDGSVKAEAANIVTDAAQAGKDAAKQEAQNQGLTGSSNQ